MLLSVIVVALTIVILTYLKKNFRVMFAELKTLQEVSKSLYTSMVINPCIRDYMRTEEFKEGNIVFYVDGIRGRDYILNYLRYENGEYKGELPLFNPNPLVIGIYKNDRSKIVFTPPIESNIEKLIAYYKEYYGNKKNNDENGPIKHDFKLTKEVSEAEYRIWLLNSLKEEEVKDKEEFFNSKAFNVLRNISLSECKHFKRPREAIVTSDIEAYCKEKYGASFSKLLKDFDEEFKRVFKK